MVKKTKQTEQPLVDPSALYVKGVEWIACNDNAGDDDGPDEVAGYISVCLLADLFGMTTEKVARHVIEVRHVAVSEPFKRFEKDSPEKAQHVRSADAANASENGFKAEIAAADWKVEGGTERDTSWTKSIEHAVKDSKQREIGNVAVIWEVKGEQGIEIRATGFYVRIWSTRDGKRFGAIPTSTRFDTLDDAKQAADEKLLAARKRTAREVAKGIVRGAWPNA